MSRWSRRSQEDKERIAHEQVEARQNAERAKDFRAQTGDAMANIYSEGEIPIMCPRCMKPRTSEVYIVNKTEPMPGYPKVDMVHGRCMTCKTPMKRILPNTIEELAVFALTAAKLQREGRWFDNRNEEASP